MIMDEVCEDNTMGGVQALLTQKYEVWKNCF